jgi:hypothetical protein
MKTKTKKCGVFVALAAVLLVSAALVTSCPEALDFGGVKAPEADPYADFVPPEGMGFIRFNIDVEKFTARTTSPTVSTYTSLTSFGHVELYITGGDGGTHDNATWNGAPVAVNTSETAYGVTVVGYNSASTPVAVALGTGSVIVSTPGTGEPVSITMKEITTGTYAGNGTLALSLNNGLGVTTATANIIGLSSGATHSFDSADTDVLSTTSFTLAPGFYRMELSLAKADHASATIREAIIIWSGLTTTYTRTLSLISMLHTVTYNYHDLRPASGTPPTTLATKQFAHNADFTHPTGAGNGTPPVYLDSANDPDTDMEFVGWYTKDGTPAGSPPVADWGTLWTAGTTKVIAPRTVHARWTSTTPVPSLITVNIAISFSGIKPVNVSVADGDGVISPEDLATYQIDQSSPPTLTFTVTNTTAFPGADYEWHYMNNTITTNSTNNIQSVDFAQVNLTAPGAHIFTVIISEDDGDSGTEEYNATITITVVGDNS